MNKCICIKDFPNPGYSYNKGEFYYYQRHDDANVVNLNNRFGNWFDIDSNSRRYMASFNEHFIDMEEYRENKLNKILA